MQLFEFPNQRAGHQRGSPHTPCEETALSAGPVAPRKGMQQALSYFPTGCHRACCSASRIAELWSAVLYLPNLPHLFEATTTFSFFVLFIRIAISCWK